VAEVVLADFCLLKFADDTKILRRIRRSKDNSILQKDLNKLVEWSSEWLMLFNAQKCKIMHIGKNNTQHEYFMNDQEKIHAVKEGKDLGVTIIIIIIHSS